MFVMSGDPADAWQNRGPDPTKRRI
jgi:hypothetical protein